MSEEKIPEIVTMQQVFEVTHSPTIGELVKALAKAQLTFKPVLKQVDNAAFMRSGKASKYADLAEYIDATQESLAKNELVVMQWPDVSPDAKTMTIESLLCHGSGEWMRGRLTLPALGRDGFTAQSCGSSITYGRRYSYAAITGCASQDDDGNSASGKGSAEDAKAVGEAKVAALKAKKAGNGSGSVTALFYVEPENQNGHFAEFINLRDFAAGHPDIEDSLRMLFTTHKAKKTKSDTVLVPSAELLPLLEKLAGDMGVTVKKLDSHA